MSSIAAAGMFEGIFREDMFEEAENLEHPYFRTKHEAEGIVRKECKAPWRIYRPSSVVGDSRTGEMDKIDGPYYFFKIIQKIRKILPPWMPTIGLEGGRINIVPVDFVVAAMDHIAHQKGHDGKCFHLTDPHPHRVGDVLQILARAAHAPDMGMRINAALLGFIPRGVKKSLMALTPVRRIRSALMKDLGLPDNVLDFINYPTRFDCRETEKALEGTGIAVPPLETYAWRLWDYWERHLDPDLFIDRTLKGQVKGKVVLVTGGSSGIGKAVAHKVAEAGAITIIVARDPEKLAETKREFEADGLQLVAYSADISNYEECDDFVKQVIEEYGGVDILINNAGRSIRRAIENSFDRFHDFERCMQLNYFAAVRVAMGFLPGMIEKKTRPHHQHLLHRRAHQRAALLRLRRLEVGAGSLLALRRLGVRRPRHRLHHHQHAAGAHAHDRADQDVPERADPLARRGRRPGGGSHHPQADTHRHPARHLRPGGACRLAEGGADHHEHQLPHVPRFVRSRRQEGRRAGAADRRPDRLHAADARHPLLRKRL